MLRRLRYYIRQFIQLARQQGGRAAFAKVLEMVWRRRLFLQFASEWMEFHLIAPRRSALATVRSVTAGAVPLDAATRPHLLLYSSFDPRSRVGEHVQAQVQAYHAAGFCTVFTTTSDELPPAELEKLAPYCAVMMHRRNIGIDFGSWKAGYDWLHSTADGTAYLDKVETVLLANDSCYGPFADLAPFIATMRDAPNAVYGMTRSLEISPYLQSYFLHFGRNVVARGLFARYMRYVRLLRTKLGVGRFLEIGGSTFLEAHGVPLRAFVDAADEPVRTILRQYDLTDPIRDPAGRVFLEMGLTPFHKRSNDLFAPSGASTCADPVSQ